MRRIGTTTSFRAATEGELEQFTHNIKVCMSFRRK